MSLLPVQPIIDYLYILASVLFIVGLKMLSRQETARRGNLVSGVGMLVAIVATCLLVGMDFRWILLGALLGSAIGAIAARAVAMTSMPEMVGLLNGFGGLASAAVAWAELQKWRSLGWAGYHETLGKAAPDSAAFTGVAVAFTALIGALTFSGSIVAFLKLSERIDGKPILFAGQKVVNGLIVLGVVAATIVFSVVGPGSDPGRAAFFVVLAGGLVLGITSVIPIGGADMPVVISLLNSYSGVATAAAGFILFNNVLIVAGALVGASGLILTRIMCKAMNRSLANVLFGGFGSAVAAKGAAAAGEVTPISAEDAGLLLEAASSVVLVPGYGMAVAQAQHVVRELALILEANGTEVKYCIHPVAGRMPGHMNVLLAEANVPYEQLVEPGDVNPIIDTVDVAIVIGANDVVNPAAKEDPSSPLWGMPIVDVDRARACIVLKRSMKPGFAGVDNPLFLKERTRMLFGDAKASLSQVVGELKETA